MAGVRAGLRAMRDKQHYNFLNDLLSGQCFSNKLMLINCVKSAMKEATERIKMGLGLFTKKSILTLMIFFMLRLNLTVFLNNESGW